MTNVNAGKAQQVAIDNKLTWDEYRERVFRKRFEIKYRDEYDAETGALIKRGEPILLDPESEYSFLLLKMQRRLTEQEFGAVYMAIMGTIASFEEAGHLPKGLIQEVGTPFDLIPPDIPEEYEEELGEGEILNTYVVGDIGYRLERERKPLPPVEEGGEEESSGEGE